MERRTSHPLRRGPGRGRAGFTLVELLVVLVIISIIAAVTLPVVIPAISHRQVSETARIIQGGLIAARDTALRANSPRGIRFLPDPTYSGIEPGTPPTLNGLLPLASNRFIPIEQPPGYSEGSACLLDSGVFPFTNYPVMFPGVPADVTIRDALYQSNRVGLICQGVYKKEGATYLLDNPTSWYWNVRVGDKIRINGLGPLLTIVGPMDVDNPEQFVNVDPANPALELPKPPGMSGTFEPEILFFVNAIDDDEDGYIDNGRDGIDNDGNGLVDDVAEWAETNAWPPAFIAAAGSGALGDPHDGGVPYQITRQPVPSPGARETVLPESVVVDLTGWALNQPERSRLPVDPVSGTVDILLDPSGRVIPTTRYSSPTSFGMNQSFYHIWVAERSDLAELRSDGGTPPSAVPLVTGGAFYLPMPLGMNRESDADGPNGYDLLVNSNPTLPYLKGEMRLLTLSTRTGNLVTTDRPIFSVVDPSHPYHAPQTGEQGDAP